MELTTGGVSSLYYFQRNLQGDVVAIYDTNGALKAKYLYDAWGNCTISGETTSYDIQSAKALLPAQWMQVMPDLKLVTTHKAGQSYAGIYKRKTD